MSKTVLKLVPHQILGGQTAAEVWHDDKLIGTLYGEDGPGVRLMTKKSVDTHQGVVVGGVNICRLMLSDPVPDDGEGIDTDSKAERRKFLQKEWEIASGWFSQMDDQEVTDLIASLETALTSGFDRSLVTMPVVHLARLSLIELVDRFKTNHKIRKPGPIEPSAN